MKILSLFILILLPIFSCSSSQKIKNSGDDGGDTSQGVFASGSCDELGDPLTIESAELNGGNLVIKVGHSGGCQEHEYGFVKCDSNTDGGKLLIGVRHDGNNDNCEAFLQKELTLTSEYVEGFSNIEGIDGQTIRLAR